MSQFPGFSPGGGDVGMTDVEDESTSISRTAEHFGSSLRISPAPLSIPNPTANYFNVTAAYFPSQLPPPMLAAAQERLRSDPGVSSANAPAIQPTTPSLSMGSSFGGNSAMNNSQVAPPAAQPEMAKNKGQPRNKVPLEKGYSQMVWLRTMQNEADPAGLKGQSRRRLITMDEIKKHRSPGDAWTVLRGRVYNITPYLRFHPGGRIC